MDPLSDMISLLHPQDCVAAGLDAGGDWSIRFDRHEGLKCNAVLKGSCWLAVEGVAEPLRLEAGDCVILPQGRPFLLSARRARLGEAAETIYAQVPHGSTAVYGGGGDFFMTGSRFLLCGPAAKILLATLPPVLRVRPGPQQDAVRWSLDRIAEELRIPRPGGALSIAHLSHFVLVQVIRCHLEEAPPKAGGWLAAIADRHILQATVAMHSDLTRPWTVEELAARAGLSRTSFAVRFRQISGLTPIGYLTQFRMLLAANRLRRTEQSVAQIAGEVGYASESAFAVAFKRVTGCSPRRYALSGGTSAPHAEQPGPSYRPATTSMTASDSSITAALRVSKSTSASDRNTAMK